MIREKKKYHDVTKQVFKNLGATWLDMYSFCDYAGTICYQKRIFLVKMSQVKINQKYLSSSFDSVSRVITIGHPTQIIGVLKQVSAFNKHIRGNNINAN